MLPLPRLPRKVPRSGLRCRKRRARWRDAGGAARGAGGPGAAEPGGAGPPVRGAAETEPGAARQHPQRAAAHHHPHGHLRLQARAAAVAAPEPGPGLRPSLEALLMSPLLSRLVPSPAARCVSCQPQDALMDVVGGSVTTSMAACRKSQQADSGPPAVNPAGFEQRFSEADPSGCAGAIGA